MVGAGPQAYSIPADVHASRFASAVVDVDVMVRAASRTESALKVTFARADSIRTESALGVRPELVWASDLNDVTKPEDERSPGSIKGSVAAVSDVQ